MFAPASYIHLPPGASLPEAMPPTPTRVVVVIEEEVSPEWQAMVSTWLVASGCLYMMAWGIGCSSWDDSVDTANLEAFNFGEIPESRFVMPTWHADEPLSEVFWYAKHNASHPTVELRKTTLLHISTQSKEQEVLTAYTEA